MDDIPRLESEQRNHYFDNFSPSHKNKQALAKLNMAAAGSKSDLVIINEIRQSGVSSIGKPSNEMHLNQSRRRILNDFISLNGSPSKERFVNRNVHTIIKDNHLTKHVGS